MPEIPHRSNNYAIVRSCLSRIVASQSTGRRRMFGRQILHYSSHTQSLKVWFWPVYDKADKQVRENLCLENARVCPSDLTDYCRHHDLRAPSCLCALMDGLTYTESSIRLAGPGSVKAGTGG
ncbi:hypothetical protein BKA70DRAFT_1445946 [Coprinopsis sp. MPI-PUGE-AT-0042]|nr:hypothetical protein BKA70DRAFT_1445946 [Coprinopsis sp. MPI-PUGE-AT-0042]